MNKFLPTNLPSGWKFVPMWSIATRKESKGYSEAELLSVYREYGVIRKRDRDDNHNVASEDLTNYKFVNKGDLVINKMKTWQGSLGISKYEGIVSPAYFVCAIDPKVNSTYLHFLLRSAPYIATYGALSKGIRVGQWDLPYEEFRQISVILPPIDTQASISNYLTTRTSQIDKMIELKQRKLELLLELRESTITFSVTGSVTNEKESNAGWLRRTNPEWRVLPGNRIFKERSEKSKDSDVHLTPSQTYGVIPQKEYMARTGSRVVLNLTGSDSMKHVEPNDFIIHLRSFQGGIEISHLRGKVSNAYCVLIPNEEVLPGYYRWLLKSNAFIQELSSTTDQLRDGQSINFKQIRELHFPLPPLSTQIEIARFLDKRIELVDQLIDSVRVQKDLLKEYKASLITDVVTGNKSIQVEGSIA